MAATTPSTSANPNSLSESNQKALTQLRRSPVPLNAAQEGEVKELYYKRVRGYCAPEIREFAHCATGRTFSTPFVCRQQRLAMEKCMNLYATRAEEDAAREEWFVTLEERKRKKEADEAYKDEQRRKKREWWQDFNEARKK